MLDTVKAKPSRARKCAALTASVRDGRADTRSGRKKAFGEVERKKGPEAKRSKVSESSQEKKKRSSRPVPLTQPPTIKERSLARSQRHDHRVVTPVGTNASCADIAHAASS